VTVPTSDDLLTALWTAIERAGAVERELRRTADELAGWRDIAQAAITALDRELARHQENEAALTVTSTKGDPC
jgi:hypothetical protein